MKYGLAKKSTYKFIKGISKLIELSDSVDVKASNSGNNNISDVNTFSIQTGPHRTQAVSNPNTCIAVNEINN